MNSRRQPEKTYASKCTSGVWGGKAAGSSKLIHLETTVNIETNSRLKPWKRGMARLEPWEGGVARLKPWKRGVARLEPWEGGVAGNKQWKKEIVDKS